MDDGRLFWGKRDGSIIGIELVRGPDGVLRSLSDGQGSSCGEERDGKVAMLGLGWISMLRSGILQQVLRSGDLSTDTVRSNDLLCSRCSQRKG